MTKQNLECDTITGTKLTVKGFAAITNLTARHSSAITNLSQITSINGSTIPSNASINANILKCRTMHFTSSRKKKGFLLRYYSARYTIGIIGSDNFGLCEFRFIGNAGYDKIESINLNQTPVYISLNGRPTSIYYRFNSTDQWILLEQSSDGIWYETTNEDSTETYTCADIMVLGNWVLAKINNVEKIKFFDKTTLLENISKNIYYYVE